MSIGVNGEWKACEFLLFGGYTCGFYGSEGRCEVLALLAGWVGVGVAIGIGIGMGGVRCDRDGVRVRVRVG
jgi:hypothetical protein